MWTGRIAVVRGVIGAAAACASRFSVTGSMSAKTGRACSNRTLLALATNEKGDVTTSSPPCTPAARRARWRPAAPARGGRGGRGARRPAGAGGGGGAAEPLGEAALEGRDARAERQLPRAQ